MNIPNELHIKSSFENLQIDNVFDAINNKFSSKNILTLVINCLLDDNDVNTNIDYISKKSINSIKISGFYSANEYVMKFMMQLPNCVKYLTYNDNCLTNDQCTHVLSNLPCDLQYLELCSYCNCNLDMLPMGLKSLSLGYEFDKPLNNLPNGLERLHIEGQFNQTLDNLPDSLKYLYLELNNLTTPITKLPNNLECFSITLRYDASDIYEDQMVEKILQNTVYPDGLETFVFSVSLDDIPHDHYDYISKYGLKYDVSMLNFPKKIKTFILGHPINTVLDKSIIPQGTKVLHLNYCYNLDNLLDMPDSVKICYLNNSKYKIDIDDVMEKIGNARNRCPNCKFILNTV